MSSAQLETRLPLHAAAPVPLPDPDHSLLELEDTVALKQQIAARLAAHRARRPRNSVSTPQTIPIDSPARDRAARIAAAVAERYANTQSYHAFLAAEAENALRQAEAAAEAAAAAARAIAAAQLSLLAQIEAQSGLQPQLQISAQPNPESTAHIAAPSPQHAPRSKSSSVRTPHSARVAEHADTPQLPLLGSLSETDSAPRLTIRLYEDPAPLSPLPKTTLSSPSLPALDPFDEEGLALDDEIAFRQSPTFVDSVPPSDIPANLLEFPRQLVAARRARPRLAEGPLREDPGSDSSAAQLRIFEVEPAQISPAPAVADAAPEWTSIVLSAQPVTYPADQPIAYPGAQPTRRESTLVTAQEPDYYPVVSQPLLQTAPLELRIMAAAVDTCIVLAAMLAFLAVAVFCADRIPSFDLPPLSNPGALLARLFPIGAVAAATFLLLSALYQLLFFTFSNATPGMNYARIGLCTFSDGNPTRHQMRRRVLAFLVSACPLGLGLLWSWIDTDRLGWHDRLSRMYQRSY